MKVRIPPNKGVGRRSKKELELYQQLLKDFADDLIAMQESMDFHVSARGWCYLLEHHGEPKLDKTSFDYGQAKINEARLAGFLKPGFILEEEGHSVELNFDFEETPEDHVAYEYKRWKEAENKFKNCWNDYDAVDFWEDQEYYIQLLVEKSDLKSLFRDTCEKYRINVANLRGWGSYEQKAVMARKFKEAEEEGKIPVLFECGDHDPPGIKIADILKGTFEEYSLFTGWNPKNLIVDRIGLKYEFIKKHKLTWIDNLMTASGKNLADPNHKFYKQNQYDIQGYIKKYGIRKCEANSILVVPDLGRKILTDALDEYLGADAYEKYMEKVEEEQQEAKKLIKEYLKK